MPKLTPPPTYRRWTKTRKCQLMLEILRGTVSVAEAAARYSLHPDELREWRRKHAEQGVAGLRATPLGRRKNARMTHRQAVEKARDMCTSSLPAVLSIDTWLRENPERRIRT